MRAKIKINTEEVMRLRRRILNANDRIKSITEERLADMAEKFSKQLKDFIEGEGQTLFKPISYRKGLILIRTRTYIDSIRVFREGKNHYYVGFHDSDIEPDTKIFLIDLADRLENGTVNMDARPHWFPVHRKFRKSSFYRLVSEMVEEIYK